MTVFPRWFWAALLIYVFFAALHLYQQWSDCLAEGYSRTTCHALLNGAAIVVEGQ